MDFDKLNLKTKSEVIHFLNDLDACQSSLDIVKKLSKEKSDYILSKLSQSSLSLEELKADIKRHSSNLNDIVLYISFEPSNQFVNAVSDIFQNHKNSILDIRVSPEILGGAKISVDGKMYDESIKSKIEKYLK